MTKINDKNQYQKAMTKINIKNQYQKSMTKINDKKQYFKISLLSLLFDIEIDF